jgi:tetratricopeptide (TPR) repeat protein
MASPVIALEKERWTAYFLGPEEATGKRQVLKSVSCPTGKLDAVTLVETSALPSSLEVQAWLLSRTLRQLGNRGGEAHLITVPETGEGVSLYRIPRRNSAGAVLLGQDFRLTFRPGAREPFTFTRFHRITWTLSTADMPGVPKGSKGVGMFHNHLDLADPCETDVAAAVLNSEVNVMVLSNDCVYTCAVDGSISSGPKPDGAPQPEGKGGPAQGEAGGGLRAFSFDQSALDLENNWAIQPAEAKDTYTYVCAYLDLEAGFTSQIGGQFVLDREGRAKPATDWPKDKMNLKIRLQGDLTVASMPPGIQKDLGLESPPEFLKYYRREVEAPEDRLRRGLHLNHIGESQRALAALEPLYGTHPKLKGLAFELAYAYNALRQLDKALPVLAEAAKSDPKDPWIARELAYTYLHIGRFQDAVAAYQKSLPLAPEDNPQERSEQAINLAMAYDQLKDTANRDAWLAKAKAWAPAGSPVANYFAQQEAASRQKP